MRPMRERRTSRVSGLCVPPRASIGGAFSSTNNARASAGPSTSTRGRPSRRARGLPAGPDAGGAAAQLELRLARASPGRQCGVVNTGAPEGADHPARARVVQRVDDPTRPTCALAWPGSGRGVPGAQPRREQRIESAPTQIVRPGAPPVGQRLAQRVQTVDEGAGVVRDWARESRDPVGIGAQQGGQLAGVVVAGCGCGPGSAASAGRTGRALIVPVVAQPPACFAAVTVVEAGARVHGQAALVVAAVDRAVVAQAAAALARRTQAVQIVPAQDGASVGCAW